MILKNGKIEACVAHVRLNWFSYIFIFVFPIIYNKLSIKEDLWIKDVTFEKFEIRYVFTVALMTFLVLLFYKIEESGRTRGHGHHFRWRNLGWKTLYFCGPLLLGILLFMLYTIGLYVEFDHGECMSIHFSRQYAFFTFVCTIYALWFERLADERRRLADNTKAVVLYTEGADLGRHLMQGINTIVEYYTTQAKDFLKTELSRIEIQLEQTQSLRTQAPSAGMQTIDPYIASPELTYFLFYYNRPLLLTPEWNDMAQYKLHAIVFIKSFAKKKARVVLIDGTELSADGILSYLGKNNLLSQFGKIAKGVYVNLLHINLSHPQDGQLVVLQARSKKAMQQRMSDPELIKIGTISTRIKDYLGDFLEKNERLSHEVWDSYVIIN